MKSKLTIEDINEINACFDKLNRTTSFLPVTLESLKDNKELLEECIYCVDDMYHSMGVDNNYEPNEYGLLLYHIVEKLNHQIYLLENQDEIM